MYVHPTYTQGFSILDVLLGNLALYLVALKEVSLNLRI